MEAHELDYDLPRELIAQHTGRAARRVPAARLLAGDAGGRAPRLRRPARLAVRRDAVGRQRHARRARADRDRAAAWRGAAARAARRRRRGRRSRGRRGGCGPGARYGPVELARAARGGALARAARRRAGAARAPLPPYITSRSADAERYQTVYARERGLGGGADGGPALHAGAARAARRRARDAARRARHVPAAAGRDASRSTRSTASATRSTPEAWERIRAAPSACSRSARRPCACSRRSRAAAPLAGRTELFITPGFEFRRVDHLLTNFHLPRSTLLALVMAFAGVEETRAPLRLAIDERYRFYSFGDAMLIL